MHILPAESAHGYQPQRHPGVPALLQDAENEALPEGLIRGRVEALLADGQVRVSAAGRLLQFMPPRPLAPGDFIELKVTAREPQLVLQIAGSSNDLTTELSSTATLIARLSSPGTPRPGLITAMQPLLPAPPLAGAPVAAQLAQAISGSGLFYESHQAEWVEGRRALGRLATEPQARLQLHQVPALPVPQAENGESAAPAGSSTATQAAAALLHSHPDTLPLVRSQLDALDSRRLLWSGELWPGQQAQWEISLDEDEDQSRRDHEAPLESGSLQTRISLVLPRLGTVIATLQTRGDSTGIRIEAASADSARAMQNDAAGLRTALAAAGVVLRELQVAQIAVAPRALPALLP